MDEELERKNKKLEEDPYDYNLKDALYTEESKVRVGWDVRTIVLVSILIVPLLLLYPPHVATNGL
jgi:hypothetical protein